MSNYLKKRHFIFTLNKKYLHKTGKCELERTEKGLYLKYIDRSPEAIAKQAEEEKRALLEIKYQKKQEKLMEKQLELARNAQLKIQGNLEKETSGEASEIGGNKQLENDGIDEEGNSNEERKEENLNSDDPSKQDESKFEKPKIEFSLSFKSK